MKLTFDIDVENQKLTRTDNSAPVSDSMNFLQFEYNIIGVLEAGVIVTPIFSREGDVYYPQFKKDANKITGLVPHEVILFASFQACVFTYDTKEEKRVTFNGVDISVKRSGFKLENLDESKTIYEQILEELANIKAGTGGNAREIELQTSETYIQWRYKSDETWNDLIALENLKGRDGTDGKDVTAIDDESELYDKTWSSKKIDSKLKDIVNNGIVGKNVEPAEDDIPRIYLSEGILPTTKDSTMMKFEYISKTAKHSGYVEIKCQGNSSMNYPKKNFTWKLYKDIDKLEKMKIDFKGWGKQNKFVTKANWIDLTHARNVVTARLWGDVVKSRIGYNNIPELLRTSPNQGAIDGFPIKVYSNGVYQGRYTMNIPKDGWMANMDKNLDNHCILCGESYDSGCFRKSAFIDGSDWTDELHDIVPQSIKTRWNQCINFVMNSTDNEFKTNIGNYFDIESIIDYLLFGIVSCGLDAFGKNQLYFTYDGLKWYASMYDMDSTWGLWWDGTKFVASNYSREQFEDSIGGKQGNLLYIRVLNLFTEELKARYSQLRKGVLSNTNILERFERFIDICPQDIVKEDYASTTANGSFTNIPSKTTNNIQQLRKYIVDRLSYSDTYMNTTILPTEPVEPEISVTGLTLDKDAINLSVFESDTSEVNLASNVTYTGTIDFISSDIELQPGMYEIKNIGEGNFAWIGLQAKINNEWKAIINGSNSTEGFKFAISNNAIIRIKGWKTSEQIVNNTNFGLFKLNNITITNVYEFTKLRDGIIEDFNRNTHETSNIITLDPTKCYLIRGKNGNYDLTGNSSVKIDNNIRNWSDTWEFMVKSTYIDNATSIQISTSKDYGLSNIELVEMTLSDSTTTVYGTDTIIATLTPSDTTNKNVTWTSSDTSKAIVEGNGLNATVTAVATGNATITCTSDDTTNGTISDSCVVIVSQLN